MADHGDETAEFLLNKTFNGYNARRIIEFIYKLQGNKRQATASRKEYEELGKNTVDYCTDYKSLKNLDGFDAEKLSTYEFAALKYFIIKEKYHIDCMQVKDCILYKSSDYAKLNNKTVQDDILARIGDLSKDKNKVKDIVKDAKIQEQNIEKQLFLKLPYSHGDITSKQRVTKRAKQVSKAKIYSKKSRNKTREFAQSIAK